MATERSKKAKENKPESGKREMIRGKENLLIEKEKRYQKEIRRPQVEKLTLLKETKKKAAPKASVRSKK